MLVTDATAPVYSGVVFFALQAENFGRRFTESVLKEDVALQAELINPFLTSSIQVIETIIQVKPTVGKLQVTRIQYEENYVWLKIEIVGQVQKEILFGFPERMAINMVSMMMGGYQITELDEMCMSAVAELGNMISGNASTMLYHNGITVDITPPSVVGDGAEAWGKQAMSIPLSIDAVGDFDIHIMM